jgi:hypothetical protein
MDEKWMNFISNDFDDDDSDDVSNDVEHDASDDVRHDARDVICDIETSIYMSKSIYYE